MSVLSNSIGPFSPSAANQRDDPSEETLKDQMVTHWPLAMATNSARQASVPGPVPLVSEALAQYGVSQHLKAAFRAMMLVWPLLSTPSIRKGVTKVPLLSRL